MESHIPQLFFHSKMLHEYSVILSDAAENLDPLHNCQKKSLAIMNL